MRCLSRFFQRRRLLLRRFAGRGGAAVAMAGLLTAAAAGVAQPTSSPAATATPNPAPSSSPSPAALPLLDAGVRALESGVPEVAVAQFQRQLAQWDDAQKGAGGASGGPPPEPGLRRETRLRLAEAFLAAGRLAEALAAVRDPELRAVRDPKGKAGQPERLRAMLLEARILAASREWPAALALYDEAAAQAVAARPNTQPTARPSATQTAGSRLAAQPASPAADEIALGRAECLRALGRRAEALTVLEFALKAPPAHAPDKAAPLLALRLAELYLESDDVGRCSRLLAGLPPLSGWQRAWRQYLEARLLLAEGKAAAAAEQFERLLQAPATRPMRLGAALGLADARAEVLGLAAADEALGQAIDHPSGDTELGPLFRKLDEVYNGEEAPPREELRQWTLREPPLRAGYATYYLARLLAREGKSDSALAVLEPFSSSSSTRFPGHPLLARALLLKGELLADEGKADAAQAAFEEALRAVPDAPAPAAETAENPPPGELRAVVESASAVAHFRAGDFVLAATLFRNTGERWPAFDENARFNAALAWLHQGNYARFEQEYREFGERFPKSGLRPTLILEEGLLQARQEDGRAAESLRQFIRDFPGHQRVPEAWLALAELAHLAGKPDEAARLLMELRRSPLPPKIAAQADYLAIFVEENRRGEEAADATESAEPAPAALRTAPDTRVARLCREFLEHYPASPHRAEVRLKLGEALFRGGDLAGAQTQFETLARETPGSPLVEAATFLSAQAALKRADAAGIDRAIALFGEVAAQDGPLRDEARLQLAALQSRMGNAADAVKLYDDLLQSAAAPSANAPTADIRAAATMGKADNLFLLGTDAKAPATDDPKAAGAARQAALHQALELYERLAQEGGDIILRRRARHNAARTLEALGRMEEALAANWQVLDAGAAQPQEYFWFYKAGFDAGRICEARGQWKSAVAVYEKLAAPEGPRAAEARARARQLRLEHFIWDTREPEKTPAASPTAEPNPAPAAAP